MERAIVVIMPVSEAKPELLAAGQALSEAGLGVLAVDDGVPADGQALFQSLAALTGVDVLHLPMARELGVAVRTAALYLTRHAPALRGVVLWDPRGGLPADDVIAFADTFKNGTAEVLFATDADKRSLWHRLAAWWLEAQWHVDVSDVRFDLAGVARPLLLQLASLDGRAADYWWALALLAATVKATLATVPVASATPAPVLSFSECLTVITMSQQWQQAPYAKLSVP